MQFMSVERNFCGCTYELADLNGPRCMQTMPASRFRGFASLKWSDKLSLDALLEAQVELEPEPAGLISE
jgi:hypothetical protein